MGYWNISALKLGYLRLAKIPELPLTHPLYCIFLIKVVMIGECCYGMLRRHSRAKVPLL